MSENVSARRRCRSWSAAFLALIASLVVAVACPAHAQLNVIVDSTTGIKVGIPRGIVGGSTATARGSNWKASDNRFNMDALNFRGQRTLDSVYQAIRSIRGRSLTRDQYEGSSFTVQGRDSDGSIIYVQGNDRSGEVRALSIVYAGSARAQMEPIVAAIIRSYEPFPELSYTPPPVYQPQPPAPPPAPPAVSSNNDAMVTALQRQIDLLREQQRATEAARTAQAAPQSAAEPSIAALQRQLEEMNRRLQERDQQAARQTELERQAAREKQIRDEEQAKYKDLEEKLRRVTATVESSKRRPPPILEHQAQLGPLPPGRRVAFVVGINNYQDLPNQQLERAVNDARLMKATFERLGFEVQPVAENVRRREFAQAWQTFLRKIEPGSTAAFFFAGHGVQLSGQNFLLTSDVPNIQLDGPELLQMESLNFANLHADILARKPKVSLLILDACRNNPFNMKGRSIGGSRGLTTIKPIEGSFVLYSANADEQALDSLPSDSPDEPNSVFTRVLAPMLLKPDMTLQEIARQVRIEVNAKVSQFNHKQWPSYYDGLTGNVCLSGNCRTAAAR